MNPRVSAAKILTRVCNDGQSLTHALDLELPAVGAKEDQALVQEITYGVLRWYLRLQCWLSTLLQKPLKAKDSDISMLLLIGLYQLQYMRVPDHAAVAETVAATRKLNKPWAKGLVNGVLRTFLRQHEELIKRCDADEVARYSHPVWLLDAVKQAWPCSWQSVLDANNVKPPMTLRVNERQYSRDEYLQLLTDQGIKAQALTHSPVGVGLEQPTSVTALPLFEQGAVSVQDQAAQLAAGLLQHRPGERVLDVCAAPGGKAMHILEAEPALQQLVALDIDAQRATRITDSLRRHQFSAEVVVADATRPEDWWDGQQFDRILLDAPCSALGVIRRHPDIKMLRRARDIDTLVKTQVQILDAVWPLLKRGGVMLYATCSILPQENSEQITRFLQRHDDATSVTLNPGWGLDAKPGRQILPGDDNMDGFFYARVDKL